jgi:RimJ/RimL family protein N-acetyltransferase
MTVSIEKMNFRTFAKNSGSMYALLDANRDRLSPWFWWADKKVTPNKFRFALFVVLYIATTTGRKIAHKFDPKKLYDEPFYVYDEDGKIGGMMGLENIDVVKNKDAEMWGFAFKGYNQTMESVKILEDYCINTLHLNSIYGRVQSDNKASRYFWARYGYDSKTIEKDVPVSEHNPKIVDLYTYVKFFVR